MFFPMGATYCADNIFEKWLIIIFIVIMLIKMSIKNNDNDQNRNVLFAKKNNNNNLAFDINMKKNKFVNQLFGKIY